MDRRRPWLRWLALELALTTTGAFVALVCVALVSGSGRLLDDPTPRPISAEIAALTEPLERAAFIKTFTVLAALFGWANLAAYVAFVVRPKDASRLSSASSVLRRHFVILLLLATFVFEWAQAWLTTLFDSAAVPYSIEPLLAWIVVGGALWALVLARFARPAWPSHSAVGLVVAVGAATVLSFLRKSVETTLFTSLPLLAWLLLDKRLAEDGPDTKPVSATPAEPTRRER